MIGRIDIRSLRFRILLLAAATIGLTLVVAAVSVKFLFEQHMERRIGDELETRLADLAGSLTVDENGHIALSRPLIDMRYEQVLGGAYWQVSEAGKAVLRSRSLWDETLAVAPGPGSFEPVETTRDDGSQSYVLARPLRFGPEGGQKQVVIAVALDHRDIEALSEAFGADLNWALAAIALTLFAGALVQMNIGLKPMRRLRAAIKKVRRGETTRLIGAFPSEVQPLADDLNGLLDRQEALLQKARDRAGTLAHGFKTPLTILALEARKLEEQGKPGAARVLREQTEAMRRHVERELNRARVRGIPADSSAIGAGLGANLHNEATRIVDLIRRMPRADELAFVVDIDPSLTIRMDPHDLREVLGNLIDNARKFAQSRVEVRAGRGEAGEILVDILDDGVGFEATRDQPNNFGSGLGLSIASDVLEAYGSMLAIDRVGTLTRIHLSLKPRTLVASTWRTPPAMPKREPVLKEPARPAPSTPG